VSLWERVVQANRPGPPEHSIPFRVASAASVCVAAAACWHQGQLSAAMALFTIGATVVGNVVSYRRRADPWPAVKPILAVCAVGGFVWFIAMVTHEATPGDISTVEGPLAILFAWVLTTHAFDVPARKDVAYSLAGSAALMAVAAAQSVDLSLAVYVIAWAACGLFALVTMWQSIAGVTVVPWRALAASAVAVLVVGAALVSILPAPRVSASLIFPSASAGSDVNSPNNLTDGGASLPAHAASPGGRIAVGGFLGFAKSLDTASRVALGDQVVMRVRATRPNFWTGETYDQWNGQSWLQSADPSKGPGVNQLPAGSPFTIPATADEAGAQTSGPTDVQTFFLAQSGPNLVFHADQAQRVYIQSRTLLLPGDGTIVSSTSMGAGTIYTVVSDDTEASGSQLRAATVPGATPDNGLTPVLTAKERQHDLELPHPDARVAALASRITSGVTTSATTGPRTYDVVESIESWMASNVRYTTNIPRLPSGADAVDTFLFGSRQGYCEQISTATVVMLRSLGIPAREAVGYVPGSYNPITDLYDVEAKDAHAWVQVWFPGYGWQNFDPTAVVPLANPTPGSVIAHAVARSLGGLPWAPMGALLIAAAAAWVLVRRRDRKPATWAHQVASDLARGGASRGLPRRSGETLTAYGERLAGADAIRREDILAVTRLVERYTYGGIEPTATELADALAFARRYRARGRNVRGRATPAQERESASASSKEAPAASSGR
jgi:transglutaminase-like putative cysteine protease